MRQLGADDRQLARHYVGGQCTVYLRRPAASHVTSAYGQTLKWNADNRLGQVSHPGLTESYLYDENGVRIRKTSNGVSTFYPFGGYAVTGGEVTKHYFFNGEALALRKGSGVYFLYPDRLGSTIRATDAYNQVSGQRGYDAFGGKRRSSGELPTDYLYTGQEEDSGTGLLYYNARYYDPQLGQFLSPDTLVPEPTSFLDYNRYLYARGNPLKYSDPSGHYTIEELEKHFGVDSFDGLMALFEEGGAYDGLEGWYDVLRAAQDGDTVTATNANPNVGMSFTGTFMRSAEGKIQVDMGGSLGIAPEIRFAYFGGIVRNQEGNVAGFGTYELRGQEYAWRAAVAGGRRHGDMQSCMNANVKVTQ
jgi:RHS repeat-associated protein